MTAGVAQSIVAKTKKPTPLLFAADEAGAIYAYTLAGKNQSPLWSVKGAPLRYPSGLWVDGSLNLYVSDESGYVFVYDTPSASGAPGAPSFTYDDYGEYPVAVAVCGDYVYAANSAGEGSAASLTVWQKGVAKPLRIATTPHYVQGSAGGGVTCDPVGGGAFFGYDVQDNGPAAIDLWPAGAGSAPTTLPMLPNYLEGLSRSKAGVLVVGDEYSSPNSAVQFYKQSGQLTHQIVAPWVKQPLGSAYESSDQALWVADAVGRTLTRIAPASGKILNTVTQPGFANLSGVAVSPPDHP